MTHANLMPKYADWLGATMEAWQLGIDSAAVIAMRLAKLGSGQDLAGREMSLMMSEKVQAVVEMQMAALTGSLGSNPAAATRQMLKLYSGKVNANRRRLG